MDSSNAFVNCRRYVTEADDKSHPRAVTLVKDKYGFGFTLRHFIVYPPSSVSSGKDPSEAASFAAAQWKSDYRNKPMDTIFIREVKEGSPAHNAGLNKGDRIIAINNHPLSGKSYSEIIYLILKSGETLRLLVVPKEDDILQLYFASSAYQPVHREHKQHKHRMPSFRSDLEQSNQFYRQSSYGTYPGRIHKKAKAALSRETENVHHQFCDGNGPGDVNRDQNLSNISPVAGGYEKKAGGYDIPSPSKCLLASGCFSEDEGIFHHAKELENEGGPQSTKLKADAVANLYYSLCNDQPSNIAFSSEENLNYPLYMSDFDEITHCDNMADARAVSEALMPGSRMSHPLPNSYERPVFAGNNHACDRGGYASDVQTPSYYAGAHKPCNFEGLSLHFPGTRMANSGALLNRPRERVSFPSDYDFTDNPNIPSINVVAKRRHQFESGDLLAESLERMNLYRSELSRMSKPNHIQMVSSRTAEFESKSVSPTASTYEQIKSQQTNNRVDSGRNYGIYANSDVVRSVGYDSLDNHNSNKSPVEDTDVSVKATEADEAAASSDQDECHIVRRISYLRATANERMNVESDLSEEDETSDVSSPNKEVRVQKLKTFFGEKTPKVKQALHPVNDQDTNGSVNQEAAEEPKSVYGWVICKVVSLEGKRSSDRSWRHLWAILRDNILYLLKERREPSKGTLTGDEHVIDVKYSIAKAASDYVKRKNVLRLMLLNGTEYLFQTESHTSMMEWLKALQIFTREISEIPEWLRNTSVLEKAAAYEQQIHKGKSSTQHHNVRKLVFRHRNPSEHSPTVKTRRASQGDELALTKIGVIWRDRMVQGWKKVHGMNSHIPKGASFGVKLENAPPGVTNEHIPLIVELCIQIVESRGLDTVGIYRVPGNNASVSILTDLVNQGIDDELLKDARWNDVNIVSSLLKAFFRKLPEPLLTSHLYPKFIMASETEDAVKRLKAIKHVLYHLPVHYFATLRYLMYHLKKVVEHSATNKMEARNLAIVFGPTLVRTTDNNMVAMVTDMPQQCYLIETMITYAEWLFEECGDLMPLEISTQDKRKTHPPSTVQSTALLSNINKLDDESLPHEMFTSLCNAASRHLRHRHKKKDPASYSKKRSGIIADDTDIFDCARDKDIPNLLSTSDSATLQTKLTEPENLSDISFGSCSSLISGSSKSKQRSVVGKDPPSTNGSLPSKSLDPDKASLQEDDYVGHRYDMVSALAQEKVKNFEQETKALLRRDVPKPRASVGTPQVEWEQIEKEWQKAKLEMEQEDLLDYLADDPSYLSCLLNRGREGDMPSPPTESKSLDLSRGRNSGLSLSSSSSAVKDLMHSSTQELPRFTASTLAQSRFQCDKQSTTSHGTKGIRTKAVRSEMSTSASQPALTTALADRTGGTLVKERPSSSGMSKTGHTSTNPHSEPQKSPRIHEECSHGAPQTQTETQSYTHR